MVQRYIKRPVVIDAIQFDGYNYMEIKEFVGDSYYLNRNDAQLYIKTLEGDMKVSYGDYIIKGVEGEFYPCKPDIFNKTYKLVEE